VLVRDAGVLVEHGRVFVRNGDVLVRNVIHFVNGNGTLNSVKCETVWIKITTG